eukprot:3527761-Prymnesium_polylepis.1
MPRRCCSACSSRQPPSTLSAAPPPRQRRASWCGTCPWLLQRDAGVLLVYFRRTPVAETTPFLARIYIGPENK